MKKLLLLLTLIISSTLLAYAGESDDIFYVGPWTIESFDKMTTNYSVDAGHGYSFSISPDEKWLVTVTYGWGNEQQPGIYTIKVFDIQNSKYYEKKIKFEPIYNTKLGITPGLHWQVDCFTKDGSCMYIDRYKISLRDKEGILPIEDVGEEYKKIKPTLISIDSGKCTRKDMPRAYKDEWAWSQNGDVLYEIDNDLLMITPHGLTKKIDYSEIINELIRDTNRGLLRFFGITDSFFEKKDDIDKVSDEELRKAITKSDDELRKMKTESLNELSQKDLEKELLSYREMWYPYVKQREFINDIFGKISNDISKLSDSEIKIIIEKIYVGLNKIKHEKDLKDMSREDLMREMGFATELDLHIFNEYLSPSPDGKWLALMIQPHLETWGAWGGGVSPPCGVLINLVGEDLKVTRFAKEVYNKTIWSDDSKRLYFCANGIIRRLIIEEKQ